jgi:hypothetical protein
MSTANSKNRTVQNAQAVQPLAPFKTFRGFKDGEKLPRFGNSRNVQTFEERAVVGGQG